MPKQKILPYVHTFRDRHNKTRHYFRRSGFKRIKLPGLYASPEFMAAYTAALGGEIAPKIEPGASLVVKGSVGALVAAWYQGADYKSYKNQTKVTYRGIAEAFRKEHGHRLVADMTPVAVTKLMGAKADTPSAANNFLKVLRSIMRFAVSNGWRADDPTRTVRPLKASTKGFHTWTEAEISQFQAFHKVGTRARLALDLLLYTGQRRSDVILMGPRDIQDGLINVTQQKTGVSLLIPIHPELRKTLEAVDCEFDTFLNTYQGEAFTAAGFGNWFKSVCLEAKLPDNCSAHGLRKAAARRLAEAGCTTKQIAAVTGHTTLKEVERYTAAAEQLSLARDAMAKLPDFEQKT